MTARLTTVLRGFTGGGYGGLRGHMHISPLSLASASGGARRARRRSVIDCLEAIIREGNMNSRTAGVAAGGGAPIARRARRASCWTPHRASLTSNSPRAPLRQANNDPIRTHPLSGWEARDKAYGFQRGRPIFSGRFPCIVIDRPYAVRSINSRDVIPDGRAATDRESISRICLRPRLWIPSQTFGLPGMTTRAKGPNGFRRTHSPHEARDA